MSSKFIGKAVLLQFLFGCFPSLLFCISKEIIPKIKRVDDRLSSSACPKYWMINNNIKALISLEISLWTKYFRFHNLTWLVWIETTQPQTCREVTTMTGFQEVSIKFLSSLNIEFPTRHPKTDCSFVRCLHTELCSNIDPRTEMSIYPDKDNKSSKSR